MTPSTEQTTRRNIRLTRWVVALCFGVNAAVNLALIGYFARRGGLDLVGDWAWLNAILMNVLILDLGLTEALTFRIARDGLKQTQPLLRTALRLALAGVIFTAGASCLCLLLAAHSLGVACLAALAAVLQLAANWRISIRLGQHQQYWFNLKTLLRVGVQTVLAIWFIEIMPQSQFLGLAFALAAGGMVEFLFAIWATQAVQLRTHPAAPLPVLASAARPFALTNLAHRSLQPLSILLLGLSLNTAAVAVFSLALRIPTVISQAISEALRGLLSGLAQLSKTDPERIAPLLRDSFIQQIILLGPMVIFVSVLAPRLLQFWLGTVPEDLVTALRLLLIATALSGFATPFHWANFALGQGKAAARAYAIGTCVSLLGGALALLCGQGLLGFILVFGLVQSVLAVAMLAIAQVGNRLVSSSLARIDWQKILLILSVTAGLAFAAEAMATAFPARANLFLLAIGAGIMALATRSHHLRNITGAGR